MTSGRVADRRANRMTGPVQPGPDGPIVPR
jgi:hypothetical protein